MSPGRLDRCSRTRTAAEAYVLRSAFNDGLARRDKTRATAPTAGPRPPPRPPTLPARAGARLPPVSIRAVRSFWDRAVCRLRALPAAAAGRAGSARRAGRAVRSALVGFRRRSPRRPCRRTGPGGGEDGVAGAEKAASRSAACGTGDAGCAPPGALARAARRVRGRRAGSPAGCGRAASPALAPGRAASAIRQAAGSPLSPGGAGMSRRGPARHRHPSGLHGGGQGSEAREEPPQHDPGGQGERGRVPALRQADRQSPAQQLDHGREAGGKAGCGERGGHEQRKNTIGTRCQAVFLASALGAGNRLTSSPIRTHARWYEAAAGWHWRRHSLAKSGAACPVRSAQGARAGLLAISAACTVALSSWWKMANGSTIEWTDATWNPVTGCTKISRGCDHCYAERFSERFRGVPGHPFESGFDLTLRQERLSQPLDWKRPRMIFVNSMSDLFHKEVPQAHIAAVFDTMERANWHTYQILTKRSSLLQKFVNNRYPEMFRAPAHLAWRLC